MCQVLSQGWTQLYLILATFTSTLWLLFKLPINIQLLLSYTIFDIILPLPLLWAPLLLVSYQVKHQLSYFAIIFLQQQCLPKSTSFIHATTLWCSKIYSYIQICVYFSFRYCFLIKNFLYIRIPLPHISYKTVASIAETNTFSPTNVI